MNLGPDVTTWPPEWRERYEERAAIHEYEANMPRAKAEAMAKVDTRRIAKESGECV